VPCPAIAALLRHLERPRVLVGIGGALVQFHPTYFRLLQDKLKVLAPDNVEVGFEIEKIRFLKLIQISLRSNLQWKLVESQEGSLRGAALVAAVADKLHL
jgi:hypothetical protein